MRKSLIVKVIDILTHLENNLYIQHEQCFIVISPHVMKINLDLL